MPNGDPPNPCDPACQKIIIDTGMGRFAARFYASVLATMSMSLPEMSPKWLHAPQFYVDSLGAFAHVAQGLNSNKKLTDTQRVRLMTQVDKACYRADRLIAWGQFNEDQIIGHAEAWTVDIFEWAKDDQLLFTALVAELGDA